MPIKSKSMLLALLMLAWAAAARAQEIKLIKFTSSVDGKSCEMLLQLPSTYDPARKSPLVVWVNGMYRDAAYGMKFIGPPAERKGWLAVCADMRGERTGGGMHAGLARKEPEWDPGAVSLGAPKAQRDVIDSLAVVLKEYPVDQDRIYLAGASSGAFIPLCFSEGQAAHSRRTGTVTMLFSFFLLLGRFIGPWLVGGFADRGGIQISMTAAAAALVLCALTVSVVRILPDRLVVE